MNSIGEFNHDVNITISGRWHVWHPHRIAAKLVSDGKMDEWTGTERNVTHAAAGNVTPASRSETNERT